MNCNDIKIMIYEYLDGELPKEEEPLLFTHIANCSECREEFKQQNLIKHTIQINQKEVTDKFEKRVFDSIREDKKTFKQKFIIRRSPVYFNYVLGGIIILIALLSFFQIGSLRADLIDFKGKYEAALFEYRFQTDRMNNMLEAKYNSQQSMLNNSL